MISMMVLVYREKLRIRQKKKPYYLTMERRYMGAKENRERQSMDQNLNELLQETKYQLFHYPETDKKQMIKYVIKRIIRPAHTPKKDTFFWPHALLTQSLEEAGEAEVLKRYYDLWIEKGMPIHNIDNVMHGYSLLYVYEKTGEEKYKLAAERLYMFLVKYQREMQGCIPYRKGNPNHIYVDGVGMIVPFLCRYGKMFEQREAMDLGIAQIRDFLESGMDEKSSLPYHGYDLKTGVKYGIIGWGRALGWLLLAMADSYEFVDEKDRQWLSEVYRKLLINSLSYLRKDGYFSWQITAVEGPKDTSATAMIGYALKKGKIYLMNENMQQEDRVLVEDALKKIESAMVNSCKNGKIYDCSGECHGFSQYPQVYGAYPWSLGPGCRMLLMK